MPKHRIIGLMSGTSLDGLDLAYCEFDNDWNYEIAFAETIPYTKEWTEKLKSVENASASELAKIHFDYGSLIGQITRDFCKKNNLKPDFVSSHGHTIFHQPELGFTFQIGAGAAIATQSNYPVICDFRSTDIAKNGQGAPLVPIGDQILFSEYTYCINIGGFANISFQESHTRKAFDICPANIVLNHLANELNTPFDKGGELAQSGSILPPLLSQLNSLEYYQISGPKSLGKEWFINSFLPILNEFDCSIEDKLRTVTEHITTQISQVIKTGNVLITGGGAYNSFLIERLRSDTNCAIVIPKNELIEYKEALIFALLGLLRWECKTNTLSSVTGAKSNSIGGAIYLP